MKKKSLNPLEDPPTASSSEDNDEMETSAGEEEEEDEDSSSSGEESKDPIKSASNSVTIAVPGKTAAVAAAVKQVSDSGSGSETETDSDSETEKPTNPPIQGSGKAVASAAKTTKKNDAAKPSATLLALPAKSATKKRSSEGTSNAKRAKKVTSGDEERKIGEDTKKPAFHRLWSEEDEISVLQGMIDFKSDTGKSPYEDTNGFYEFIKKSISFEVSKNQFMDKIRSLKKKFISKGKNGVEPCFSKAHDQKSYELSKIIWGPEGIAIESVVKSNGVSKKSKKTKKLDSVKQELNFAASPNGKKVDDVDGEGDVVVSLRKHDWFENSFLVRSIAGFGVDEHYVKQKWSLVPMESKQKIEDKVKDLQANEFEFVLEKTDFLREVTSMIVEASKNKPLGI